MNDTDPQVRAMIDNLAAKTGRPLPDWIAAVKTEGLETHGAIIAWLKGTHGMTHGYANLVAHYARAGDQPDEVDLIDAQFARKKAHLRPILDAILAAVTPFGEVEIAPKKTCISLRRAKQFALVQPSTATRVNVCIQLKGVPPTDRLQVAKSTMTSHQVGLTAVEQVDAELIGWLRDAWERAR